MENVKTVSSELITYIVALVARVSWLTVDSELELCKERNITTVEEYEYINYTSDYSDLYKDVWGMRPKHAEVWTLEQLKREYNSLCKTASQELQADNEAALEEASRNHHQIDKVCTNLGISEETYDRWMLDVA